MQKQNLKFRVTNAEDFDRLQVRLFSEGYHWFTTRQSIKQPWDNAHRYLFTYEHGNITQSQSITMFNNYTHKEMLVEDYLKQGNPIVNDLIDQAKAILEKAKYAAMQDQIVLDYFIEVSQLPKLTDSRQENYDDTTEDNS